MPFAFRRIAGCVFYLVMLAGFSSRSARAGVQSGAAGGPTTGVVALLQRQAADWNRGDLDAFATGYKDAPDILFLGKTVEHGYRGMLEGYKRHYPTRVSMGMLTFSQLEVQPLDPHFATCTGHFHLQRTAAGGGVAEGYFLLVLEKTGDGWKIVRDDTTSLSAAKG